MTPIGQENKENRPSNESNHINHTSNASAAPVMPAIVLTNDSDSDTDSEGHIIWRDYYGEDEQGNDNAGCI